MDIRQKTKEVEQELLDVIIKHLNNNKIDMPRATQLAKDFLSALPIENQQDLLTKLKSLSTTYGEAKSVYMKELADDIRAKEEQALTQMHSAITSGNIEQAISVAKSMHS